MKTLEHDEVYNKYPIYNPTKKCDTINGPCACGAWHQSAEIEGKIKKKYNVDVKINVVEGKW